MEQSKKKTTDQTARAEHQRIKRISNKMTVKLPFASATIDVKSIFLKITSNFAFKNPIKLASISARKNLSAKLQRQIWTNYASA